MRLRRLPKLIFAAVCTRRSSICSCPDGSGYREDGNNTPQQRAAKCACRIRTSRKGEACRDKLCSYRVSWVCIPCHRGQRTVLSGVSIRIHADLWRARAVELNFHIFCRQLCTHSVRRCDPCPASCGIPTSPPRPRHHTGAGSIATPRWSPTTPSRSSWFNLEWYYAQFGNQCIITSISPNERVGYGLKFINVEKFWNASWLHGRPPKYPFPRSEWK